MKIEDSIDQARILLDNMIDKSLACQEMIFRGEITSIAEFI